MPVTDLAALARDLTRIHDAVVAGGSPPSGPRALVARSWNRMIHLGVDPTGGNLRQVSTPAELETRKRATKLRFVIDDLTQTLLNLPDAADYILVVTDADGVILWRDGASRARHKADGLGFVEGGLWTESTVGTNAIGTALAEEAPVQLFSAEHFETTQHPWFCSAVPVHDPSNGSLLGIVDISGPAFTVHPYVQALVATAVRLAEAQLRIHHQDLLLKLRNRYAPVLSGGAGPAVVVDEEGWVAFSHGVQNRDRVETPSTDRALFLPGVGLCIPEKVEGGWLLRPNGAHRVEVRLSDDPAELRITSHEGALVVPLTPRHHQVLREVTAAGPQGISARELSVKLYGDADHQITVRAEVSRLRRSVGALLSTQPYRWSEEVVVAISDSDLDNR